MPIYNVSAADPSPSCNGNSLHSERNVKPLDPIQREKVLDIINTPKSDSSHRIENDCLKHSSLMYCMAYSPDGRYLATGGYDAIVRLWKVSTRECHRIFKGHTKGVYSLAFSPNQKYLATGNRDKTVRLWEVSTGQCLVILKEHKNKVCTLAFSPDGKFLASGSEDHTACLWEVSSAIQTGEYHAHLKGHTYYVNALIFTQSGEYLATGSCDKTVRLWRVETGECCVTFTGHSDWIHSLAFSPDNRWLATASGDTTVCVWKVSTGECHIVLRGHSERVSSLDFSSNGKCLATGSWDHTVRLWKIDDMGEHCTVLKGHTGSVWTIAFSPDGECLATGSSDHSVRLWKVSTGECLKTFEGHSETVWGLDFSPDGKFLATGSDDKTVHLWELGKDLIIHDESPQKSRHARTSSETRFLLEKSLGKKTIDSSSTDNESPKQNGLISDVRFAMENLLETAKRGREFMELESMLDCFEPDPDKQSKAMIETQELDEIYGELTKINDELERCKNELKTHKPNTSKYSELQKKIDQLQARQDELLVIHEAKVEIRDQQLFLQEHPNLWLFYRTVQIKIEEMFIGYKAIASELVDPKNGKVSGTIQLLGTLISLIPVAGTGVACLAGEASRAIENSKQTNVAKGISLLVSVKGFQKLAESIARILTLKYQEDILNLKTFKEEALEQFFADETAKAASRVAKIKIKAKHLFTKGKKKMLNSRQLAPAERLGEFAVLCMVEKIKEDKLDRTKPLNLDRVLLEGISEEFSELATNLRSNRKETLSSPKLVRTYSAVSAQVDRTEKTMRVEIRRRQKHEDQLQQMFEEHIKQMEKIEHKVEQRLDEMDGRLARLSARIHQSE